MARHGSSPFTDLIRLISWHRRKLAVLAAMSAAALGITAATPDPPPTTTVTVAAHRLTGGQQLTAGDVTTRDVSSDLLPVDAITRPDSIVGRTLVAPLSEGSVLTSVSVLRTRPESAAGLVITPLRIGDAAVLALLRVGDRVDVVASDPESGTGARVIAEQVRVVTIPRTSGAGGLGGTDRDAASLLLVEVDRQQATVLADAAARSQISLLL
ncbi:SAF domain-containing protein [Microlunatus soli]|uniref:Flp pilus assembly protein CpaB n=1 Tax=Microlunatus soli TaxID=630515 RepID=A0A1H1RBD8_9ACTN|nr:SAF domain-containing protein [Microlunatus soli]SDS33084.1 Flp pilus assembly protein CpaB [Microlunatus soli]